MSKKVLTVLLLIAIMFTLVSCIDKPDEDKGDEKMKYSDIYKYAPTVSAQITGRATYKASYGYVGKQTQGYNNFYYEYLSDGNYLRMVYLDDVWKGDDAVISQGEMTSVANSQAARLFVAPVGGEVTISGNVSALKGTAEAIVYVNGEEICKHTVSDSIGVYHEDKITVKGDDQIRFVIKGEATVYWNPTIDYLNTPEQLLHTTVDGYYGDVHPFYDSKSGKLFMYYLSTGLQQGTKYPQFQSLATVSDNFIQFKNQNISIDEKNPVEQELYFALGVYQDKNGKYRSCYGKGNYAGASVSDDLLVWSQGAMPYMDENDGLLKYSYRAYFGQGVTSGRDPDIFYDADSDSYYCVVINYYSAQNDKGDKGLALYIADSEGHYSTEYTKLLSFTGKGDPECPQLKKIGKRWYLFYSEYGTGTAGNVGKFCYRVGDEGVLPQNVDWSSKQEYSLDGGDLHAAQLCHVKDKLYMFGWLNYKPHTNVWGGYLNLAREVYVGEDGLLYSRCDEYLTKLLNKGLIDTLTQNNVTASGLTVSGDKFTGNGTAVFNKTLSRNLIFANVSAEVNGYSCITIKSGGTTYYVGIVNQNTAKYLVVTRDIDNPLSGVWIKVDDELTDCSLKVVVDGQFIEAYLNDKYSLSAHTNLGLNVQYGLALSGGEASKVKICKLADLQNIFD